MVTYCRNKGFTGRKGILEKVESQAQMGDHNRVALWGLGGTGKTQIALRYVYQYEKKRPVFWVHGSSLEKFSEEFMRIIPYAGISQTTTDGKDGESPLALVKKWFESSGSGDWILVVDNADNESDFEGNSSPIAKYIPRCSKGTLIITTRSKQVASRLGCHGDSAIEVKRMNSKEAMKLFFSRHAALECQEDRWAVKDILRSLHYLPLAVVGAAAYMTETSTVPSVYLAMFNSEDSAKRLLSRKFNDIYREAPSGMPESILSTFFITFEQIKRLDHLAMELLQLITFLKDHQNILEDVLRCSDLEGMSDPIAARDAIGKLESYSLLTKTPSSAGGPSQPVYEFHRLVQISAEVYIREREGLEVSRWVNMAEKAELASRRQSSFVSSSLREQPNPGIEQPGLGGS
ncbi:P-loop containing nucleoside triphosphate hydrolase protein [Tuber indicum]|nr:P-loop containing nucleoside triphosphate hydrolase protein [Tuber indicum]